MKPSLAFLALTTWVTAAPLPIAIGTNTGGSGKSEGIYLSTFDPDTGTIGKVELGAKYENPGFLALHPTKPILYSVGRSKAIPKGTVAAFRLGGTEATLGGIRLDMTEPLNLIGDAWSGGENPCHLAIDPTGNAIAVANYGDGSTSIIALNELGVPFAPSSPIMKGEGKGANPSRQDGPHAHGVYFIGRKLFVPDLGLDKVLVYDADTSPRQPKLSADGSAHWSSVPGAGPRHMDFSADGKHAYVVNELNNTVTACQFKAADGTFETLHSVSTLPDGFTGKNSTAEIAVHPSGNFVYASNRGHDSIAVFSRDAASGHLTRVQIAPCGGRIPRHFAIAPGGNWLLCAHQDSNTLAALPLDPATGTLGEAKPPVACPNPICILFLPGKE